MGGQVEGGNIKNTRGKVWGGKGGFFEICWSAT